MEILAEIGTREPAGTHQECFTCAIGVRFYSILEVFYVILYLTFVGMFFFETLGGASDDDVDDDDDESDDKRLSLPLRLDYYFY
jgi:hypothetical protein